MINDVRMVGELFIFSPDLVCDCGATVLCILSTRRSANEAHPQRTLSGKVTMQTHIHMHIHSELYIQPTRSRI